MKPAVDVIYRDLDSSAALNEVISRKVEKLNRFTDQIIHSRVVLDTPNNHKHKGKQYRVLGVGRHTETLEELVMYEALYENPLGRLWCRPLKMWLESVEVNGTKVPRFKLK